MTKAHEADQPDETEHPTRSRGALAWRLLVPMVFAFAGFLFVTSAESAEGDDLRPDQTTGLAELIEDETADVDRLRAEAAELTEQIDRLSGSVDDTTLARLDRRLTKLQTVSGLVALHGPAVKAVLDDAPYDQPIPTGRTANDLVVHQQDLQAVVNALWYGGAEGITLQGQRIVSTTGIKCVGNTVLLHGVPYSPPYEIIAVGDVSDMTAAINSSEYIDIYKQYTAPPINIGWSLEVLSEVTLPPYDGAVELEYAEAIR